MKSSKDIKPRVGMQVRWNNEFAAEHSLDNDARSCAAIAESLAMDGL